MVGCVFFKSFSVVFSSFFGFFEMSSALQGLSHSDTGLLNRTAVIG